MATTFTARTVIKSAEHNANFLEKKARTYTTTATAAGTTTLTVSSNQLQFFTGTTTQTVTLPVASTMSLGYGFEIFNLSTGIVTVNSSGANLVQSMAAGSKLEVICILASGTGAASWQVVYNSYLTTSAHPFLTIQAVESGSKVAVATDNFHQLTTNSTTIAAGTWELTASAIFGRGAGLAPLYTLHGLGIFGANGADTNAAPAALSSLSNLTINSGQALFAGLHCWDPVPATGLSGAGTKTMQPIIVTATANVTIYVVTYSLHTVSADTLITAYLNARRLY